jgi:hypothetical protein
MRSRLALTRKLPQLGDPELLPNPSNVPEFEHRLEESGCTESVDRISLVQKRVRR